ncbi:MAG: hypothetical protein U5L72_10585 [Bacteroidales bacterium]|nr:hypothetical protein [Bacteroidales bacterium]
MYYHEYGQAQASSEADHAGDFVIDATFASLEDLRRYQNSEPHRDAVSGAAAVKKAKLVIDYII